MVQKLLIRKRLRKRLIPIYLAIVLLCSIVLLSDIKRIEANPGFPVVQSTATASGAILGSSATVNLPTGIQNNDLLIAIITARDVGGANAGVTTWPSGWTEMSDIQLTGTGPTVSIAKRQADGAEPANITVTFGVSSGNYASLVYRISGSNLQPSLATNNNIGSTTGDPPSLSPAFGTQDYLWLAVTGLDERDTITGPTNYTNLILVPGASDVQTAGAQRNLNTATENPGPFSFVWSRDWSSATIAVPPAGAQSTLKITANADDAEDDPPSTFTSSGTTLRIRADATFNNAVILRFTNLPINQGSTINLANIKVNCISKSQSGTLVSKIGAEDTDNASQITSDAQFDSVVRTTASVTWSFDISAPCSGFDTSPDIKSIIQEVINRAGWQNGNAVNILWEGNRPGGGCSSCFRDYEALENSGTNEAQLFIDFTQGTLGTPNITSVTPDTVDNLSSVTVTVNGSNFDTASIQAQVTLERAGESDIICTGETGTTTQITATCDFTGAAIGLWNLRVTNDNGNGTSDLQSNAVFVTNIILVSSISPSTGENNKSVNVTVTGQGFVSGSQLTLEDTFNPTIPCTDEVVTGSTQITATCSLSGEPLGFRDVVVTNPDFETGRLNSGFEVVLSTPSITSVSPTSAGNFRPISVTVQGAGLTVGGTSALKLRKSGELDIVCTGLSQTSSSDLTGTCDLTNVATGSWDVEVTDSASDTDTLFAAFTIFRPFPGTINELDWSHNDKYLAAAHDLSPFMTIFGFDSVNGKFNAAPSANPSSLPPNDAFAIEFSPDGKRLAVGTTGSSQQIFAYEFNDTAGLIGTRVTSTVTSAAVNDFSFSSDNNALAVAMTQSPFLAVLDVDTNAAISSFFTSKLADPSILPTGKCNGADFHPDRTYIAFVCDTSPFLFVYNFDNATPAFGTKLADPSVLPTANPTDVKFSPNGNYIAVSNDNSPFVEVWVFDKSTGTIGAKFANPSVLPTGSGSKVDWVHSTTLTSSTLCVAHTTTPFITSYAVDISSATTGSFTGKLTDPTTLPDGNANTCKFNLSDNLLAIGHQTQEFMTVYNFNPSSTDKFRIWRGFLFFDTSAIPDDATINKVVLKLNGFSDSADADFNLQVQSTTVTESLVSSDYDRTLHSGDFGTFGTSSWQLNASNDITLNNFPINKTGITGIVIRSQEDTLNSQPAGNEFVSFRSNESSNPPILEVTFTSAASGIVGTVLTGFHKLEIERVGTIFQMKLDDTVLVTGSAINFVDNTNDWNFAQNGSVTYMNDIAVSASGTQRLKYQLLAPPTANFTDLSGNNNDSILMSLPIAPTTNGVTSPEAVDSTGNPVTGSSPIGTTTNPTSPVVPPDTPINLTEPSASQKNIFVDPGSTPTNLFGKDVGTNLPFIGFVNLVATQAGIPVRLILIIFATWVIVLAGVFAFLTTQSLVITFITMLAAIGAFVSVGSGILPFWLIFVFAFTGTIFLFIRRATI
jgi:6-phosphogluconolactonase (cycloisomerase 2 family)